MLQTAEANVIFTREERKSMEEILWNKHATCPGVYLKHLVKGSETGGQFSCHLVKVEAGCEISEHIHANNWEIHEIVSGQASGYLEEKRDAFRSRGHSHHPRGSETPCGSRQR